MAKSLLNCVNQVLLRTGMIAGDAATLTTLTDSARQRSVDVAVQVINEGIDELYTTGDVPLPQEQAESSFTLISGTRAYSLASDFIDLRWPMIDKTNAQFLYEGDYNQMIVQDPEQDDTGLPHYAAIRPTDGLLFLDRSPTTAEAGRVYTYQYDKDLVLTDAADTVPFNDITFRAMVPVWTQLWQRDMRQDFDEALYRLNVGRASRTLGGLLSQDNYSSKG